MTYFDIKQKTKRVEIVIFQVDLDKNDPEFDEEFSTDLSSYGTPKTTSDIRAYKEGEIKTYSFCDTHIFGLDCFPYLISALSEPAKVNPGEDVGIRATASISLKDFKSSDSYELTGLYSDRRVVSSFWAKMFARNEFKFREARILRGYTEDGYYHPENFEVENYVIDTYQGPSLDGLVQFSLVDILVLTDGLNVKIPYVTTGILATPIVSGTTSCTFNALDTTSEYGSSGYWIIGSNIMQYTITSPTTANIVQNRFGTIQEDQAINASIQKCIAWDDVNAIDIIKDIFALTKIPSSYIPVADYDLLKAGELSIFNFTAVIFELTEAKSLLNEIIQHCGLTMYTDVVLKKIVIVPSSVITSPVLTFDCKEHIQEDSYSEYNEFDKLITNQFIRWGLKNHTLNERTNYSKNKKAVDIVQEDASRLRVGVSGKDILSRWLANNLDGNQIADQIITKKVAQYSSVPKRIKFKTDAAYVGNLPEGKRLWLGSTFQIRPPINININSNGSEKLLVAQCTSLRATSDGLWEVTGLTYNANIPPVFDYMVKAGTYIDYVLADDPDFAPKLIDGGAKEYIVIIEQGSIFGSSHISISSFSQGVFPVGSTLYLIVYGRILGRGGKAGRGGAVDNESGVCTLFNGVNGGNGGNALSLSTDTKLDVLYGFIAGGGGGSGGFRGSCPDAKSGNGGGGGQGFPGGEKGIAGFVGVDTDIGLDGTDGSIDSPGTTLGIVTGGVLGGNGLSPFGSTGGISGSAILTNGNTLDIISGNSSDKIKGAII